MTPDGAPEAEVPRRDRAHALALAVSSAWFRGARWLILLRPLALLFGLIVYLRRKRMARRPPAPFDAPVWVVGNIVVGGSGKSPMTLWLVDWLRDRGHRPGVVSRGYGGTERGPHLVSPEDGAARVGDEPLMIRRRAGVPVCVARDRAAGVRQLLRDSNVDWVVSDDGLQHYRMHRDLEIVTFDGALGLGTGWMLPAGPLREPVSRLADAIVVSMNRCVEVAGIEQHVVKLQPEQFLDADGKPVPAPPRRLLAVCAIGHPDRFFQTLRDMGHDVEGHALADHSDFDPESWMRRARSDGRALVMTEKDAARCVERLRALGETLEPAPVYVLRVRLEVPPALVARLERRRCQYLEHGDEGDSE